MLVTVTAIMANTSDPDTNATDSFTNHTGWENHTDWTNTTTGNDTGSGNNSGWSNNTDKPFVPATGNDSGWGNNSGWLISNPTNPTLFMNLLEGDNFTKGGEAYIEFGSGTFVGAAYLGATMAASLGAVVASLQ